MRSVQFAYIAGAVLLAGCSHTQASKSTEAPEAPVPVVEKANPPVSAPEPTRNVTAIPKPLPDKPAIRKEPQVVVASAIPARKQASPARKAGHHTPAARVLHPTAHQLAMRPRISSTPPSEASTPAATGSSWWAWLLLIAGAIAAAAWIMRGGGPRSMPPGATPPIGTLPPPDPQRPVAPSSAPPTVATPAAPPTPVGAAT